jgi:hypothetical protein
MKACLMILLSVVVLFIGSSSLHAQIVITVNGQSGGASFAQDDTMKWDITGLSPGMTVNNQLWIDLDSNGIANPSTDVLFVSFPQTDGVGGSDGPPPDMDGSANGIIHTELPGLNFPPGHYIFKTIAGTDSASTTFTITVMLSKTYSISGSVTYSSTGVQNIVVRAENASSDKSEYYGLTDAAGSYTIFTNLALGTVVRVHMPTGDFNSSISGYVATPSEDTLTLTGNMTGVNFVLTAGKIITGTVRDTIGNPLSNIDVFANIPMGGNNYEARTDGDGKYFIAVPPGMYQIQFGSQEQTTGYILTYYNQKYVPWLSDSVEVTSLIDTVKNIDVVLRKGGVITGTVANAEPNGWNISAFNYGVQGNPLFAKWFNNSGTYSFTVLPGTYSIQFNKNGGSLQFYYNQIGVYPGTAVTVNAIGDTARNIDADFNAAVTGVDHSMPEAPTEFSLFQNYPNPFNPSTEISYQLPMKSYVTLKVYNVLGKEVATLVNRELSAGSYTEKWNASQFASGIYFYKLQAGSSTATMKLVLMK